MSKISSTYPDAKRSRKAKILEKQAKIDAKNSKARAKAKADADKARLKAIDARKAKPIKEQNTEAEEAAPIVNFASDEAAELAVSSDISDADKASIKGTGKDGSITVKDVKDFLADKNDG